MLQQIAADGNYDCTIEESKEDVYLGQHTWSGYCYDPKGNLIAITSYGEGDSTYTNNDERAKEIADWIKELKERFKNS